MLPSTTAKAAILLCFVLTANFCSGQNLVPNPSFEDYNTCPYDLDYIENAIGWLSTRSSPNYFNSCAEFVTNNSASVPCNVFGCQYPASGNCYAGFYAKSESSGYREYLGSLLIDTLQVGTIYYVSFKINLSSYPFTRNYCGVNNIGALFSTKQYSDNFPAPENNYAHVFTQGIIIDTLNWIDIKGSFIADSAYSFISIGNFFNDINTDTIQVAGTSCQAYYFVDDVCVSTDSSYCYNYTYTKVENRVADGILIYPNPATDYINIDLIGYAEPCYIYIYDELGNKTYSQHTFGGRIEHIPIDSIAAGAYFCQIVSKNKTSHFKVIKHTL